WTAEALRERPQHGAIARFGTVDEIAHTALFLASPESGFITGVTLSVDGGAVAAGAYMVEKYRRRKATAEPRPGVTLGRRTAGARHRALRFARRTRRRETRPGARHRDVSRSAVAE